MKKKVYVGVKKRYDKSHLKMVKNKGYEGVVYIYILNAPGDEKDGWVYVGCTPEEETRRSKWNKAKNKYAGTKIADARERYGVKCFTYKVLETHYDPDIDKLVEKLEEREAHFIEEYNSIGCGFNGNKGGTGRKGQKISKEEIDRRNATRGDFHHTDATKQRISQSQIGRKQSDEAKAKISAGNKGKKRTEAMNKAQSDRMKGKVPTAATEAAKKWREENGGSYWKGKEMSADAKANMKAAQQERGISVGVIFPDGHTEDFTTMLDASKRTGDGAGSVKYSIEHGSTTKRGYKYIKL